MSGPEGSSIKHCIVCAVGIFCPEHSTLIAISAPEISGAFLMHYFIWVSRRNTQTVL